MTETMLAPMAKRGGTPGTRVSIGTIITPPPRPSRDPGAPAVTAADSTMMKKSSGFKKALIRMWSRSASGDLKHAPPRPASARKS